MFFSHFRQAAAAALPEAGALDVDAGVEPSALPEAGALDVVGRAPADGERGPRGLLSVHPDEHAATVE